MIAIRELIPAIIAVVVLTCGAEGRVQNIYWNTTTARQFPVDEPQTVVINEGNLPWEYDQVNIICPVYKAGRHHQAAEQHIIYSVEREEFDSCRVTSPRPRIVAVCNRPHTFMYFTITFRSFTPTPGGLEFRPGRDYYFISTSNSKDLHRRVGGWCSSHNMRMIFRVAEKAADNDDAEDLDVTTNDVAPSNSEIMNADEDYPAPTDFWSRYYRELAAGQHKDSYLVRQLDSMRQEEEEDEPNTSYRQSHRDTYFGNSVATRYGLRTSSGAFYHPRRMDKSVDIRITAVDNNRPTSLGLSSSSSTASVTGSMMTLAIGCLMTHLFSSR